MDFNKLAQEINQINQEKGFNDLDRRPLEIIALIHSEISEATEQFMKSKPNVWYGDDGKPEGFYVELIDALIRSLGYIGNSEYNLKDSILIGKDYGLQTVNELEICAVLHFKLSEATEDFRMSYWVYPQLAIFADYIYGYFKAINEIELFEKLLREKIEYNKTRPYLHGNKEA